MKYSFLAILLFVSLFLISPAEADVQELMKGLIKLRSEVEVLSRSAETERLERVSELDAWNSKRLELDLSIQKESMRNLQIEERLRFIRLDGHANKKDNASEKKKYLSWIENAQKWVESSIPFNKQSRELQIKGLAARAMNGTESIPELTSELWAFYESELKLAVNNEYLVGKIPTSHNPTDTPVEIARLGTYALIWRDSQGSIRQSLLQNGVWKIETVPKEFHEEVLRLMTNLKSKKSSGFYKIPLMSINNNTETL